MTTREVSRRICRRIRPTSTSHNPAASHACAGPASARVSRMVRRCAGAYASNRSADKCGQRVAVAVRRADLPGPARNIEPRRSQHRPLPVRWLMQPRVGGAGGAKYWSPVSPGGGGSAGRRLSGGHGRGVRRSARPAADRGRRPWRCVRNSRTPSAPDRRSAAGGGAENPQDGGVPDQFLMASPRRPPPRRRGEAGLGACGVGGADRRRIGASPRSS